MYISPSLKRTFISSSLLALFSSPTWASERTDDAIQSQETNGATNQDETITVVGQMHRNATTKTSLAAEETPQGLSFIESEELEYREVQSLNQALRYTPGVVTETKGTDVTLLDNYYVRGFAVNKSYYDGLALPYLTNWNLQFQPDPITVQQIEVFKGPTSVLYGAMNPGGMVNMVAKSPQMQPSTTVSISGGSRDLMEASIDTTGQIGDSNLSYRLIGLARQQDTQADYAESERYVLAPSLNWQISDKTLVNFNVYYQKDPAMGINSGLPASGMITSNPNGSLSSSTFAGDVKWNTLERDFLMFGYKLDHQFDETWSFMQNTRYTDGSFHQRNTYNNGLSDNGILARSIYSTDEELRSFAIDNQISGNIRAKSWLHNLLVGIDYQELSGKSNYKNYATGDISGWGDFNIFSPNNNIISDPNSLNSDYNQDNDISFNQFGVYFQDQIKKNRLVLLAGGRFDLYKSDNKKTVSTTTDISSSEQSQFTYRVGALYTFDNGVAPFVSYATGFEPTTDQDKNGEAFKPESSQQIELGVKYQSQDMTKSASASIFYIEKNDRVVTDPSDRQNKLQVGQVVSQGFELQGRWQLTDAFDIAPNYTYIDKEVTEDPSNDLQGTTPIYVPEHSASVWANYHIYTGPLAGTRFSGGARYVGTMQMDATNTQGNVPAYTVADISIGYDLSELSSSLTGASANMFVNNVFDEENYVCYDNSNCWYGEERSISLTLKYQM
ncbi:TonB-dependent siderophore receptor [Vibrio tetraodonis]|uniref:TonB-dependent siderophore receptor n=1 Tax=Vibrio tetraodonis TaxID=2231647 RepID=UPI000E0A82AB|nr:TonB-dependent siderophore receptor [Vibrio tetraodonis]